MIRNIFANVIGRFWSIVSNYLFIPFYISLLGLENYAVISFTLVLIGIMSMMSSSLSSTLSREFAKQTSDIEGYRKKTLNTLELCYWVIVVVVIIGILFAARPLASKWITLKTLSVDEVTYALQIFGIGLAFQLVGNFYMGGLIGLQHQVKANIYQIAWGVFRNGFVLIIIYFHPSLIYFFSWQLITTLIYVVLLRRSLMKSINSIEQSAHIPFTFDRNLLRQTGRFVSGMLLISIIAAINMQLDKLAISKLMSIEQLGYYNIAISLTTAMLVLITPVSVALLPHFTGLYSRKKEAEAGELFKILFLLVSIITFSVAAILIFYGNEIIYIWTGNQMLADSASKFMVFSAIGTAMLATQIIPFDIAIANGYTKINNVIGVLSLFVSIPGYWLSVAHFGPIGAAVTWCIIQVIITPVFIYFVRKRFLPSISYRGILLNGMLFPAAIAATVAFSLSYIVPSSANRWINLLIIVFASIVTLGTVTLSTMKRDKMKYLFNLIRVKK